MNLSLKSSTRSRVEPIRLLSRRHNYFPQRFFVAWRAVRYLCRGACLDGDKAGRYTDPPFLPC